MTYKNEESKLKHLLGDKVLEVLTNSDAIVAGGAITSLFTGKDVNDIDVYFRSREKMVYAIAGVMGGDEIDPDCHSFAMICNHKTDKSITFSIPVDDPITVQFIYFKYFDNAQEVFDTFDFTVNMGAYDLAKGEFEFSNCFFKHCSQRYLKFNPNTAFPLMSVLRVQKYIDRGYNISKVEMLRVIMACMSTKLESWEDAKTHIGGMYGYDMSEIFDEEREFSLEECVSQLDNLNPSKVIYEGNFTGDIRDVLKSLYTEEELGWEREEPPFREGYYYKLVGYDWRSYSYTGNPITYNQGAIVEGSEGVGIFVCKDPLNPYPVCTEHWVELKLLEGGSVDTSHSQCCALQLQLHGKCEVTNRFVYRQREPEILQLIADKFFPDSKDSREEGDNEFRSIPF